MNTQVDKDRKRIAADVADVKARITALAETLAALVKIVGDRDAASLSIKRFCVRHGISERQYFKLQAEGRGPRLMSTGSAGVRISAKAEADWIRAREAEGAERKPTPRSRSATSIDQGQMP